MKAVFNLCKFLFYDVFQCMYVFYSHSSFIFIIIIVYIYVYFATLCFRIFKCDKTFDYFYLSSKDFLLFFSLSFYYLCV